MAEKESPKRLSREEVNFADQVRTLREDNGWSQEDLADRLRKANLEYINQTTVSRIENKTRPVRLMEAQALSRIFGRTVHTMTNPDSREIMLIFAEQTDGTARRAYVAFKNAAAEMSRVQLSAHGEIDHLRQIFGTGEGLDPETRVRFDGLMRNLENFTKINALSEAAGIFAGAERAHSRRSDG